MPELRYREALNQARREELERDESVLLMGVDIGVFKVTAGLLEDFGSKRVRDTPISVSGADLPVPYSKPLEQLAMPHEAQIVEAVRALF